jgi:transposase InsO family protein
LVRRPWRHRRARHDRAEGNARRAVQRLRLQSRLFAAAIQAHGLKHKRTRPYTPRTNGKAERFIQTSLREWAYAHAVHSSNERAHAMPAWLCHSNSLSSPLTKSSWPDSDICCGREQVSDGAGAAG